jgi:hypothetical protein
MRSPTARRMPLLLRVSGDGGDEGRGFDTDTRKT